MGNKTNNKADIRAVSEPFDHRPTLAQKCGQAVLYFFTASAVVILALILTALVVTSCSTRPSPWEMEPNISAAAKALIKDAFTFEAASMGGEQPIIVDYQVHIIANGTLHDSRHAYLNHRLWHPVKKMKTRVIMDATQVFDLDQLDQQYQDRLLNLIRHFRDSQRRYTPAGVELPPLHFYLYALDYYYDEAGNPVKEYTDLYVPNEYVVRVAQEFNRIATEDSDYGLKVIPVPSVHPYRKDFSATIERLAQQGMRFIKWLPPSMNIDAEKVSAENYLAMARQQMVLLTHTGNEHVLQVRRENETFGDPYKLRKALDCGVNVVALHNGREDEDPATDEPYFDRFVNMMEEPSYQGLLFGEISAMTLGRVLFWEGSLEKFRRVIELAQPGAPLYGRIMNGSDYPVPAISFLNPTKQLVKRNMITSDEKHALDEIFSYNRLLFDFVLKRTITNDADGAALRLPEHTFFEQEFYQTPRPPPAENCVVAH